jgi:hypothetical protein
MMPGPRNDFRPHPHIIEFGVQVGHVFPDRAVRDSQVCRNLIVRVAASHQPQDLTFPRTSMLTGDVACTTA